MDRRWFVFLWRIGISIWETGCLYQYLYLPPTPTSHPTLPHPSRKASSYVILSLSVFFFQSCTYPTPLPATVIALKKLGKTSLISSSMLAWWMSPLPLPAQISIRTAVTKAVMASSSLFQTRSVVDLSEVKVFVSIGFRFHSVVGGNADQTRTMLEWKLQCVDVGGLGVRVFSGISCGGCTKRNPSPYVSFRCSVLRL